MLHDLAEALDAELVVLVGNLLVFPIHAISRYLFRNRTERVEIDAIFVVDPQTVGDESV